MADGAATRELLERLFSSAGIELSDRDLNIVSQLHDSFAGQRARLTGAARPETEPLIVPGFDRILREPEAQRD